MDLDPGLLDGLTRVDEQLQRLNDNVEALDRPSTQPPVNDTESDSSYTTPTPRRKDSIGLTKLVQPKSTTTNVETMPYDGYVDNIILGFPDGADLSVGVRVENNKTGKKYLPGGSDEFFAFNDFTNVFPASFTVKKGDEIAAVFKNAKGEPIPINCTLKLYGTLDDNELSELDARLE